MMTPQREQKIKTMIAHRQPTLAVIIENVHDPHNIMAVARSCESVGVPDIYIIQDETKPGFDVRASGSKSSGSANKWLNFHEFTTTHDCLQAIKEKGYRIFTTHLSTNSKSVYEVDMTQKIALLFGNEKYGVSEEALSISDGNFVIPQVGMIQSLNISVACAVSLYEAFRQRKAAGFYEQSQYTVDEGNNIFAALTEPGK